MHKTQSLSKPGKWTIPKGGHEIITVLLTCIGNGWRATRGNRTAIGRRKVLCTFYLTSAGLKALQVFSRRVGSYPGSPSMCLNQTQQLGAGTAAPRAAPEGADHRCWKLSYTWRDRVLQKVHYIPLLSVPALLQNLKVIPSSGALSPCKSESALMDICFNFFLPPLQE